MSDVDKTEWDYSRGTPPLPMKIDLKATKDL